MTLQKSHFHEINYRFVIDFIVWDTGERGLWLLLNAGIRLMEMLKILHSVLSKDQNTTVCGRGEAEARDKKLNTY